MSILACLIGILTLMISVSMQVQQMEKEGATEEELDRAMVNRDLKKKAVKIDLEIKNLEEQLKKDHSTVAELQKIKDRKVALTMELKDLKKAKDPDKSDAALQKRLENLKKEIAALKQERPPLSKRVRELLAEIKSRKEAPKPKESVVIRPRGVGQRGAKHLFFIECNSTGIVIMTEGKPSKPISTAAIATSGDYKKHLDTVKKTRDSMVLFLVRKSGNTAYRWAAGMAETKHQVTTGKLPIPNDGKIDLTLFKN
jgi:chaperonin cofactor prefoldin